MQLLVPRIGILKPGTRKTKIHVDRIRTCDLIIHAIEQVLLISSIVQHGDFWPIQESATVQAVHSDEVAPLLSPVGKIDPNVRGAKTAIACVHPPCWLGHSQAGARRYLDNDARL